MNKILLFFFRVCCVFFCTVLIVKGRRLCEYTKFLLLFFYLLFYFIFFFNNKKVNRLYMNIARIEKVDCYFNDVINYMGCCFLSFFSVYFFLLYKNKIE